MNAPGTLGVAPDAPVPAGFSIQLVAGVRRPRHDVLVGGSPRRVLRLGAAGVDALAELASGPVAPASLGAAGLARRLADTGMAAVRPPAGPDRDRHAGSVTIVVPVRDRPSELARCLGSIDAGVPVVVVDDGSADAAAVARVCAAHGARLVRRRHGGGPAAARNAALAHLETELVAFLDSDCIAPPGWLPALAGHFRDPLTAAVAPRVVAHAPAGGPARRSALDMGPRPAPVAPGTSVPYVPTAALVVRRAAIGQGFDEALRFGEDVDFVWRLIDAGWRARYEPSVVVVHHEPASAAGRLRRRFDYGTSAGQLARRHPGRLRHLVLPPAQAATLAAVVAGRPGFGALAFAAGTRHLSRRLSSTGLGPVTATRLSAASLWQTWLAVGRWLLRFGMPGVVAFAVVDAVWPRTGRHDGRVRTARWRRMLAACTVVAPVLADRGWGSSTGSSESGGDADRGTAARIALTGPCDLGLALLEEVAYGAGVYAGCIRARCAEPILPALTARHVTRAGAP